MANKTRLNSLFVPVNLKLKEKLDEQDYKTFADRIRWLTHFLIMDRIIGREKKGGWVGIHSNVLQEALGKNTYKRAVAKAANLGIIEVDHSYKVSEPGSPGYTKKYRLLEPYASSKWRLANITNERVLNYLKDRKLRTSGITSPAQKHLWRWVKRIKIEDVPRLTEGTLDWGKFTALRKRNFRGKVCDFGRFHSNHTRLKREMRPYLRLNGQPLVEIDVRNCQPLLFAWLVCSHYSEDRIETRFNMDKSLSNNNKEQSNTALSNTTPYVSLKDVPGLIKPLKNRSQIPGDALKLLDICEQGEFYEHFLKAAGYGKVDDDLRQKKKQSILTQFYDNWSRSYSESYEFLNVLKRDFPSAYDVCEAVKQTNYQDLARLMQRVESHVVIDSICEVLRAECPRMPIITVHDAIFTTAKYTAQLKDIMRNEFRNKLGVSVMFKHDAPRAPAARLTHATAMANVSGCNYAMCVS